MPIRDIGARGHRLHIRTHARADGDDEVSGGIRKKLNVKTPSTVLARRVEWEDAMNDPQWVLSRIVVFLDDLRAHGWKQCRCGKWYMHEGDQCSKCAGRGTEPPVG